MDPEKCLAWLRERLIHQYGENPNVDFVHKLSIAYDEICDQARAEERERCLPILKELLDALDFYIDWSEVETNNTEARYADLLKKAKGFYNEQRKPEGDDGD